MSGRKIKTEGIYSGLRADGRPFPEVLRGVREIAAYLRMGTRATERWIANGMLPAPKDAKGRRWTTKSLIDKLIVQIYQLEQQAKARGALKTGKKQPRPRPGQLPAGGTLQEQKPDGGFGIESGGKDPEGYEPGDNIGYCPYCQGEGTHKAGCMLVKVRPLTLAEPTGQERIAQATNPAFKTTIEPIEIPGIGVGGKPVRGRLIISEPVDPGSHMGQSILQVEKDVPEASQEKQEPARAEHVIIHTGIIKQEDRGRLGPEARGGEEEGDCLDGCVEHVTCREAVALDKIPGPGPEFGEGALDKMPGVGTQTLIISEEVANAPCAYCDLIHPNPADCRVWPERAVAMDRAGDIPHGPLP